MKNQDLKAMYSKISSRYDVANRIITFGLDQSWRKKLIELCLAKEPRMVLDFCAGTGDLTIELAKEFSLNSGKTGGHFKVKALDFSVEMLNLAKRKAEKNKLADKIDFMNCGVEKIPIKDEFFDGAISSFSLRNLSYSVKSLEYCLKEVYRVIKKGAWLFVLETTQPTRKFIQKSSHFYFKNFVPFLGWIISGNYSAYKYLADSAVNFFAPSELEKIFNKIGFRETSYILLSGGITAIHVGRK
jgi:demethylmenaquinone methyltransferase/2-methoxy-6-polyprenyl-1,4-benzoquinol methylase